MAGKILPNKAANQTPGKAVTAAFSAFIFWLLVALFFPYPILLPYWPEALEWGPWLLYFVAFLNLARVVFHLRRALRATRNRPPALRAAKSTAGKAGNRADNADRASRAQARADKDQKRAAALPQVTRPPTVQRMR